MPPHEVRPDAVLPHLPLNPLLAKVRVAQQTWKSDSGLGEGKCVWSWRPGVLWDHTGRVSAAGELATVCSASVGAPRPEGTELEWAPEALRSP